MIEIKAVTGRVLYTAESAADVRASLVGAVKGDANLYGADLRGADLYGADLYGANLHGADLRSAKNAETAIAQTIVCPEGDVIGWKKCRGNVIVKLRIPADAKRSNASGRKCRAEYAEVLEIHGPDALTELALSQHDEDFAYRVGETVTPTESFDPDRWNECAAGIHFYITREEAEAHE